VTLVLAALGREAIWLLTDRRLSWPGGHDDTGRKALLVYAKDGPAMLGYAGLGRTAGGKQPADWMADVIGNRVLTLEQALAVVYEAMRRQLPRHMKMGRIDHHVVLAPALVDDEARLYSIEMMRTFQGRLFHRAQKFISKRRPGSAGTDLRFAVAGTGGEYLLRKPTEWQRTLLRLMDAFDRQAIRATAVADYLAQLNQKTYQALLGEGRPTVGPRCLVTWRSRAFSPHRGTSGYIYYTNRVRDQGGVIHSPPSINCNLGIRPDELGGALMPGMMKHMEELERLPIGEPFQPDMTEMERALNAALSRISPEPKEELK
jgi:hypothetical protein